MKTSKAILFSGLMLVLAFQSSVAQTQIPKDSVTGLYSYQGVVKVDSVSKEQLYSRAKAWILKTLKSSDNMVELDDKDFNSITGSGTIITDRIRGGGGPFAYTYENAKLNFKVTAQFKDGRLKYSFDNFSYAADKMFNGHYNGAVLSTLEHLDLPKKEKEAILNDAAEKMKMLVGSFTNEVSKVNAANKENW